MNALAMIDDRDGIAGAVWIEFDGVLNSLDAVTALEGPK
jgi:hypothetical protein